MKISKRYILLIFNIVSCLFVLIGCSNEKKTDVGKNSIKITSGSIIKENNNEYSNYVLENGKYNKIKGDRAIFSYNNYSGNYMYIENGRNMICFNGNDIEILEKDIVDVEMSEKGNYISFFNIKDYYKLKVLNLNENKEVEINSKVAISGNFVEWLNDEVLVFYGIDDKKNNGIFTYDVSTGKEELLYKINKGYIEFLKVTKKGIVFLENADSNKTLKIIDEKGQVEELNKEILVIKDVEITKEGIFVLGSIKNNNYSIYKIENGTAKRIIYDFPNVVNVDKGLSSTESGNILFLGSNLDKEKSHVYTYKDGYIKEIGSNEGNFSFVKIN